ncbi:unnamed protein product [Caenorhabditis angaria]|uniref:3-beta hydroxysteroid dehydrogenase/isomerase domain-containing protein n=1 Tax=Caenorhabditis angaria TaxID=860376 RepID=A0A9P1ICC9_9PELO|nr:unnamed protein product [Caenorhabditis angaria]
MRVTVLGNNLTARHFVNYLSETHQSVQISLWTFDVSDYPEFDNVSQYQRYYGSKNLPNALLGSDVVVNLHECTDFSLLPDIGELQLHNVEIVRSILFHIQCPLVHLSTPFIQCSNRWPNVYEPERDPMVYSSQWPFKEYCASKYEAEMLIRDSSNDSYIVRSVPTYGEGDNCSILTDLIYLSNDKSVFSLGDDDGHMQMAYAGNVSMALWNATCKLLSQSTTLDLNESYNDDELSDLVESAENSMKMLGGGGGDLIEKKLGLTPILEEDEDTDLEGCRARHNTVRSSFTGETEHEQKMEENLKLEESGVECDVFDGETTATIMENEPLPVAHSTMLENAIYSSYSSNFETGSSGAEVEKQRVFEIFLINDETPKKTVYNTYGQLLFNGKRGRSPIQYSFIPLYYIYVLFSFLVRFAIQIFGPFRFAKLLPDPSFLYFNFHHWTFFNSTKSVVLLGYKPQSFPESVEKCAKHYRQLRKKDIQLFSWQKSISSGRRNCY